MTQTIEITRRTILGFGYTSACEQTEHGLRVCEVTSMCHKGTIKTVTEKIENDRELASYQSGGTCYKTAWFIKVSKGVWKKITTPAYSVDDLLTKYDGRYFVESVTATID